MAYSDYGGYAYRNGKRVEERSDATISAEHGVIGTPGSWPGFAFAAAGVPEEQAKVLRESPHGHAVLGDGPLYVVLYKQSTVQVFVDFRKVDVVEHLVDPEDGMVTTYGVGEKAQRYVDDDWFRARDRSAFYRFGEWTLEVRCTEEDNYYIYAKLTQPDGNVWHGWSGYGVGAGLEDAGYGYSTDDREEMLREIWPEAIS